MHRLIFLSLLICSHSLYSQNSVTITPANWWTDAAFGVMFHFGLYAVPAGEIDGKPIDGPGELIMKQANLTAAEYAKFATQFSPQSFNAVEWVNLAKSAGAKYIVITAKHRDGFCLWNSKLTMFDVTDASAYRRDIVAQLATAARQAGLRFGVYYSIEDWYYAEANPDTDVATYRMEYVQPQLQEILQLNVDLILLDRGDFAYWTDEQSKLLYDDIHTLSPSVMIGMTGADETTEKSFDYLSIENPGNIKESVAEWRVSMTDSWGYKNNDQSWKQTDALVDALIDVNVKGRNLLLNVPSKAFGTMATESLFRLKEIGEWLKRNAEAIYTTLPYDSPDASSMMKFTRSKDGKWIYVLLMDSKVKTFKLTQLKLRKGIKAVVLGTNKQVSFNETRSGYTFVLPDGYSYDYACVVKIPVLP